MKRPNIEAIIDRARTIYEQPCQERHTLNEICPSCDAYPDTTIRTDIPRLIEYVHHIEARLAHQELPHGVQFARPFDRFHDDSATFPDEWWSADYRWGWNKALQTLGYQEPK